MSQPQSVPIPDVVVRQVGMLQLQLAVAQERIAELEAENAALRAAAEPASAKATEVR